jgi:hypothetical protein
MHRFTITALAAAVMSVAAISGMATSARAQTPPAPAEAKKLVPPLRGTAQIGYLKPDVQRTKDMVITKITLKNLSNAPVAGLRVEEFWYDKAGNTLPSDAQRVRQPLQPGQVVTVELRTPFSSSMNSNKYNFVHANGDVKAVLLKKIDEVPPATK